jgi:hypothetical protein
LTSTNLKDERSDDEDEAEEEQKEVKGKKAE